MPLALAPFGRLLIIFLTTFHTNPYERNSKVLFAQRKPWFIFLLSNHRCFHSVGMRCSSTAGPRRAFFQASGRRERKDEDNCNRASYIIKQIQYRSHKYIYIYTYMYTVYYIIEEESSLV